MFATHLPFRHPTRLEHPASVWHAIEVVAPIPRYIATVRHADAKTERTFLLSGGDELLALSRNRYLGALVDLQLLLPPGRSPTQTWQLVALVRVAAGGSDQSSVFVTAADGGTYGGRPIGPVDAPRVPTRSLFDRSNVG